MKDTRKVLFDLFDAVPAQETVVFVDETLKLGGHAQKLLGKNAERVVERAAKAEEFKGKFKTSLRIPASSELPVECLTVVGIGSAAERKTPVNEAMFNALGGYCVSHVRGASLSVVADFPGLTVSGADVAALAAGALLRLYRFDRYKTGKKKQAADEKAGALATLQVLTEDPKAAANEFKKDRAMVDGVLAARDLVNEPANILFPEEFAKRAAELTKLGVEVDILDEKALKKLGFGAILAVSRGAARESRVVVMRWNGGREGAAPVAFIGKGVCFDSGGLSIKPAAGMENMKGDMGGAACVTGLMRALASRKAPVNAVGVIGLVENMPDGNAVHPGDIITSLSGQTIEVINTDAEGRLVLADLLWYTQDKFKPKFMIDLATLTGAIMVALGQEYAGLFSNDDSLPEQLKAAGIKTGEKVWRMPVDPAYDKAVDSVFADLRNSAGRHAGCCTAAAFLHRFVNDVPWVHLDIAGTAMDSPATDTNVSWGSGWGVHLLDRFVRDNCEKK
ncbi:MAG: leucyl aminopeptidase [Methylobacteriaceae bacterium]|jgi:leucyl aminopeptidase|nr:leucyl aminopeptidase [Methylobacteriaceae bacterium]